MAENINKTHVTQFRYNPDVYPEFLELVCSARFAASAGEALAMLYGANAGNEHAFSLVGGRNLLSIPGSTWYDTHVKANNGRMVGAGIDEQMLHEFVEATAQREGIAPGAPVPISWSCDDTSVYIALWATPHGRIKGAVDFGKLAISRRPYLTVREGESILVNTLAVVADLSPATLAVLLAALELVQESLPGLRQLANCKATKSRKSAETREGKRAAAPGAAAAAHAAELFVQANPGAISGSGSGSGSRSGSSSAASAASTAARGRGPAAAAAAPAASAPAPISADAARISHTLELAVKGLKRAEVDVATLRREIEAHLANADSTDTDAAEAVAASIARWSEELYNRIKPIVLLMVEPARHSRLIVVRAQRLDSF